MNRGSVPFRRQSGEDAGSGASHHKTLAPMQPAARISATLCAPPHSLARQRKPCRLERSPAPSIRRPASECRLSSRLCLRACCLLPRLPRPRWPMAPCSALAALQPALHANLLRAAAANAAETHTGSAVWNLPPATSGAEGLCARCNLHTSGRRTSAAVSPAHACVAVSPPGETAHEREQH